MAGQGGRGSEATRASRGAAASRGPCAVELLPSRGAGWRAGPELYVEGTRFPPCAGEGGFPGRTHRGCRRNRPSCGESAGLGAQRGGHFIQRTDRVADAEPDPLLLLSPPARLPTHAPVVRLSDGPSVRLGVDSRGRQGHFPVRLRAAPLRRLPSLPPRQQPRAPRRAAPRPAPAPARSNSSAPAHAVTFPTPPPT